MVGLLSENEGAEKEQIQEALTALNEAIFNLIIISVYDYGCFGR